jgi:cell division protein FtsI (penicillin-binding protein 3)
MSRNFFRRRKPVEPGPRRGRMLWTSIVMALAFLAVLVNAWNIQVNQNEHFLERSRGQHETVIKMTARRGDVLDRSGRELAVTAMVPSVFANPRRIKTPAIEASRLAEILDTDRGALQRKLSSGKAFVWLKRHVTSEQATQIRELEQVRDRTQRHKPIDIRLEPRRFYPAQTGAGHLVGFTDIDGKGLEGIEGRHDKTLRGKEYVIDGVTDARGRRAARDGTVPVDRLRGHSVEMTIDLPIQQMAEAALAKQTREMGAKAAVMVIIDPRNGDIVAMAQTPAFDPNRFGSYEPADWRNRAVTDVWEPGSVIKPLLVAAGVDAGICKADSIYDGHKGRFRVGPKVFTDVHAADTVSALEIIQWSSNIGAIQLAQALGKEKHFRYLRAFGLGIKTGLNVAGEQRGMLMHPKRWGKVEHATISFGHGVSTTPIQIAAAIGAIAHGGLLMQPRLVRRIIAADGRVIERFEPKIVRRVISEAAAKVATQGMVLVTTGKGGTGHRARVPGYAVAGKTGTAHKIDPILKAYSKDKYVSSFVGFAPAGSPRLVAYIAFDEPTVEHYGGRVAGPVFAEVMRAALPYLGVKATEIGDLDDKALGSNRAVRRDVPLKTATPRRRAWWREQALLPGTEAPVLIPDLVGQSLSAAASRLAALDLSIEADGAGIVLTQEPPAGQVAKPRSTVTVALAFPGEEEASQ